MVVQRKSRQKRRQLGQTFSGLSALRGSLRATMAALLLAAVAGCASEPDAGATKRSAAIGDFAGGVSGDEPRATLVAQEALAAGGTAADAAVAMSFALAVTYPAAAALGGGGSCLIYDQATQTAETLNFLPVRAIGGGIIAVPGIVRGLAALHSRYGRINWGRLIGPAERMARRGHPASRALAKVLQAARPIILGDTGLRTLFTSQSGQLLREGDPLSQIPLSAVLAQIRIRGPGEFYVGQAANNLVAGARGTGGAISLSDLRNYRPSWHETASMKVGGLIYHTSPGPMSGGLIAGQMWAMLSENDRFADAKGAERAHLIAEVSARAYGDRGGSISRPLSTFRAHALMTGYRSDRHSLAPTRRQTKLSPELGVGGATGFVIVDQEGSAVACTLSMGRSFGAGRADRLTGVVLAAPMAPGDLDFIGPAIVVNAAGRLVMAVAAVGGPAAPAAMAQSALMAVLSGESLETASAAPRIFHPGDPDQAYVEIGASGVIVSALRKKGHTLRIADQLGRVNAIFCPGGLAPGGQTGDPTGDQNCQLISDTRGYGLAIGGDF
jgi:gamma-glutamyltranspeptidase/glutathione hydrolase